MYSKMTAFTFMPGFLNPGDYTIPFAFNMPMGIPASMFFKKHEHVKKPKAKVKYVVSTILHAHKHHDNMKYKQVLTIREAVYSSF